MSHRWRELTSSNGKRVLWCSVCGAVQVQSPICGGNAFYAVRPRDPMHTGSLWQEPDCYPVKTQDTGKP